MEKQELLSALEQLQVELERAGSVDPQTLERLQKITRELESDEPRPEVIADDEGEDEPYGLRELLLRFESEHPQLSETLGRIADGLARMGI